MTKFTTYFLIVASVSFASAGELRNDISNDYDNHLFGLFKHFHQNPELSNQEFNTAARLAEELKRAGYDVTTHVGGTGIVAIMKNGKGPLVMMRADMDALPIKEKSDLAYASTVMQKNESTGEINSVMHACGHDVHMTSLIGTARRMVALKQNWSGTLMLIGQPAEETGPGAQAMIDDNLWQRFGKPDFALAFHVEANFEAGIINVVEGPLYAGADSVEIKVHGIGAHGASPHEGRDPIVLASQIVLALQTLVSREISPREPAIVTVGSFHSGTKDNIISDLALLKLTVRNTNMTTRKILLDGIKRIAINLGRAAGLPENKLPEVIVDKRFLPPTVNDRHLATRLKNVWQTKMGLDAVTSFPPNHMGAEDFPFFTLSPKISSVYFEVGGTPKEDFISAKNGGPAVPGHHSALFKVEPAPAIKKGVEATVIALLEMFLIN